ncbi:hypothetical protein METSCH_C07700 [Metschnikowia aff. pulcherrima]|uniref:Uncharacterized protein n=1 Tax=Metschnikowia aff. pulcherrima TaxID=2163413 RepID=A0A4P6XP90_9ASCO|nr:hypothetical protein METSCH_C07700 [Metschnikowia aff. pulcherrima]
MSDDLKLARRQNDALEKSLQALRGKLGGLLGENQPHIAKNTLTQSGRGNLQKNRSAKSQFRSELPLIRPARVNLDQKDYKKPGKTVSTDQDHAIHDQFPRRTSEQAKFGNHGTIEGNYFDDLRAKVSEIRKMKQRPTNTQHDDRNLENDINFGKNGKLGEARQFLVSKIERQNENILDLEARLRELELQNRALIESQDDMRSRLHAAEREKQLQERLHQQAMMEMEVNANAQLNYHDDHLNRMNAAGHEQDHMEKLKSERLEDELRQIKKENAELKHRVSEIAERAHLLNTIHEQRLNTLESKLKASVEVAKYYCDISGNKWLETPEDSTEEILFGSKDNTTMDLLKDVPGSRASRNRRSLRSYFLAVLFMVRLKTDADALRLWNPYLQP